MEEKQWFLYVVDHHEGPFTLDEVRKKVKGGEAKNSSFVWKEGLGDWMMMSDVPDFGAASTAGGAKTDGHGAPAFVVDITGVSPSSSVWCLNAQKMFSGPHSLKTIIRKLNEGEISAQDSIWREGMTSFLVLGNVPEIMSQVKPDVMPEDNKRGRKTREYGASAAALGMGGGVSSRTYVWYKSTKFTVFVALLVAAGLYQGLATGAFKSVIKKDLHLRPIPGDVMLEKGMALFETVKPIMAPVWYKVVAMLPEPARGILSPVQLPEGLLPNDADTLRDSAVADLKHGARVATGIAPGDEFNPQFVIASNVPDGTSFTVTLRGKEGTLLNADSYEKTFLIDVNKHVAKTPRLTYQDNKPLPKGEYILLIYDADKQSSEVMMKLAAVPKRNTPNLVPKGKTAFVVDSYFLGGKKDAIYASRLKEYNERSKERNTVQFAEIKQLALTVESMANESAVRFNGVKKPVWIQYSQKYSKMSAQIKGQIERLAKGPDSANPTFIELYRKLTAAYDLSEQLHKAETAVVNGTGKIDAVGSLAKNTATAVNDLKQSLSKVTK